MDIVRNCGSRDNVGEILCINRLFMNETWYKSAAIIIVVVD